MTHHWWAFYCDRASSFLLAAQTSRTGRIGRSWQNFLKLEQRRKSQRTFVYCSTLPSHVFIHQAPSPHWKNLSSLVEKLELRADLAYPYHHLFQNHHLLEICIWSWWCFSLQKFPMFSLTKIQKHPTFQRFVFDAMNLLLFCYS